MTISHAVRRHYAERIFAVGGRGEVPEAFRPLEGDATGRSTVEGCRGGGKNVLEVRVRVNDGRVEAISMGCNLCNPAMYVAADILGRWSRGRAAAEILGLDADYAKFKNKDQFELHLRNLVNAAYGANFATSQLEITFPVKDGKEFCMIDVKRGKEPLYTLISGQGENAPKTERFYVRSGNSSRELPLEEIPKYVMERFRHGT